MVVQVGRGDGDEVRIRQWLEEKSKIRGKRVIKMEALYEKRMRAKEKAAKLAIKDQQTAEDLVHLTLFMDASHISLEQDDSGVVILQFHGVRTFDPDAVHVQSSGLWFNKRQPQRAGLIVRVGTDTGKPYWLGWQRIAFIDTQHRPDRKWHFSFSGGPDGCLIFHAARQLHTPGSNFNKTMDWAWNTLKEKPDGPIPLTARLIKMGESFYKDT